MEEFDCLQSYVGVPLAGELPLLIIIVWHSRGLWVTILLQRVNICPSMHQTRSPLCFRYGINEQILFEVGMRSEIERFVAGMIMMIQMWIAPISYSNRSAAVIAEGIEVDSKPFKSILPFEGKFFNNGILPDYGILLYVLHGIHKNKPTIKKITLYTGNT